MEPINRDYDEVIVKKAIAQALENFYTSLIEKIDSINIRDIIRSKNPYLYRAKSMQTSSEIIDSILQAFVSSSEETIFGNCFFEPIAIAASKGIKSNAEGIDIEIFDSNDNTKYVIAVKSGTSVFNADSKKTQEGNFAKAKRALKTSGGNIHFEAIVGYAYGTKNASDRGKAPIYEQVAGEEFWETLTGDKDFYTKIISFMGKLPEKYVDNYKSSYAKASNRLIKDFSSEFCNDDGTIDWKKLVDYNSGSVKRKAHEKFIKNTLAVYNSIKSNPTISQKGLKDELKLGMTAIKKSLNYLLEFEIISKGHNGKSRGWTINKDFRDNS